MAFITCSTYAASPFVMRDDDNEYIWVRLDDGRLCLKVGEAVQLRDDLSRAITEAAQKAAQQVTA